MALIKVVTDSTADIPEELIAKWDITIVPLKVHFGTRSYLDGLTITAAEFYDKLRGQEELPTTSQPSPSEFVEAYQKIAREAGEDVQIISLHLSSVLSGTYQSAKMAQNMLADSIDIEVIDSKKASYVLGMIVTSVAEAAKQGKSKEECLALAKRMMNASVVYFMVDTLHYLQKGGRIGKASALVGSLLNIKPILSLDEEGYVYPVEKVRGSKKALLRIFHYLQEYAESDPVHVAICHADAHDQAEQIMHQINDRFEVQSSVVTEIGPVIGTHVGPKTIGLMMYKEKEEE